MVLEGTRSELPGPESAGPEVVERIDTFDEYGEVLSSRLKTKKVRRKRQVFDEFGQAID
jgi:hypothetical protein